MKLLNQLAHLIEGGKDTSIEAQSRRTWLKQLGLVSASGLVLVACGQDEKDSKNTTQAAGSNATPSSDKKLDLVNDGGVLNAALALEHRAIALYGAAAGLEIMQGADLAPVVAIATTFRDHHIAHREALKAAIKDLQSKNSKVKDAVQAEEDSVYVNPEVPNLTSPLAVIRLAAKEEMVAAQTYISVIPQFTDGKLAQTSGMLGGDEAGHFGVLRLAMMLLLQDGEPTDKLITTENVIPGALPASWTQIYP